MRYHEDATRIPLNDENAHKHLSKTMLKDTRDRMEPRRQRIMYSTTKDNVFDDRCIRRPSYRGIKRVTANEEALINIQVHTIGTIGTVV